MLRLKYIYSVLLLLLLGVGVFSCTDDIEPDNGNDNAPDMELKPGPLTAYLTFADYEDAVSTRFTTDANDQWSIGGSINYFTSGDTVGIFARAGNMNIASNDGKGGPLVNIPMYFVEQRYLKDPEKPEDPDTNPYEYQYVLQNDTVEFLPSVIGTGYAVFMYYPYSPDLGKLENYPNWKAWRTSNSAANASLYWGTGYQNDTKVYPDIKGMPLRVKAPDGSIRARDVVEIWNANTAELNKGKLTGTVYHNSAALIIMRGVGFDQPKRKLDNGTLVDDYSITVELQEPITHMMVVTYSDYIRWTTRLFYDNSYIPEWSDTPMTETEAKQWKAWEGAPYPQSAAADKRRRAWYVLIPSVYNQNSGENWKTHTNRIYSSQYTARPTVSKIILYDNEGYRQEVTSFTLRPGDSYAATKKPEPRYRWPIEIAVDELGTTVRPVTIDNWDQSKDNDITEVRTVGIHDFNEWARLYNDYISNQRDPSKEETLKPFGDLIDGVWHFYVDGYDFAQETFPRVTDLQDVIEGKNKFFNVVWSNLNLTRPLFDKISKNGSIQNIDFDNIFVKSESTDAVGALAGEVEIDNRVEGQTFYKCNIMNGTVIGKGPVGLLAGSISFGRIKECEFWGFLVGDSSYEDNYKYLFGTRPSLTLNFDTKTVTYSNIIFAAQ